MTTHSDNNASLRPRRSVLYMPAANERALEKAKTLPADAIIFDLEDAVAPDAKESARVNACAAVASGEYGHRELTIRCNGLDTPWGADDLDPVAARVTVIGGDGPAQGALGLVVGGAVIDRPAGDG